MIDQQNRQNHFASEQEAYDSLELQPNSNNCFVCGVHNPYGLKLKFFQRASGEVICDYIVPEHFQGYPGVVHGGVVSAMLDEAAGRALMGRDQPRFMFTARLDLRFRKNVPTSQPLKLVGCMNRSKGRTATASSFIYDESGQLLAEAEALLVDVPEELVKSVDLKALGWRIYPEEG